MSVEAIVVGVIFALVISVGWVLYLTTRTAECRLCGQQFPKSKPVLPSLVGFSYCSSFCEARAWSQWMSQ